MSEFGLLECRQSAWSAKRLQPVCLCFALDLEAKSALLSAPLCSCRLFELSKMKSIKEVIGLSYVSTGEIFLSIPALFIFTFYTATRKKTFKPVLKYFTVEVSLKSLIHAMKVKTQINRLHFIPDKFISSCGCRVFT